MSKSVADRMIGYCWERKNPNCSLAKLAQWVEFYYTEAAKFLSQAIEAEEEGIPAENQQDLFDWALGCEMAANILDKRWLERYTEEDQM